MVHQNHQLFVFMARQILTPVKFRVQILDGLENEKNEK